MSVKMGFNEKDSIWIEPAIIHIEDIHEFIEDIKILYDRLKMKKVIEEAAKRHDENYAGKEITDFRGTMEREDDQIFAQDAQRYLDNARKDGE
jgi:hypothetical protein